MDCPMIETFSASDLKPPGRFSTRVDRWAVRVLSHPIRTPVAHVSVHVVEAKSVRCSSSDGVSIDYL